MALYSLAGAEPAPLPFRAMFDAEGELWTDLPNNPEGLAACGFVLAADPPSFDPATQAPSWDGAAWAVVAKLEPTLDELKAGAVVGARGQLATRIAAGLAYKGLHVAIDPESRSNLQALVLAASLVASAKAAWETDFADFRRGWISVEGTRIPLDTPDDGVALAMAGSGLYSSLAQHQQDLENEAKAATDPSAIPDVTTGWP